MSEKEVTRLLYHQEQLPIFQNRMYDTKAEAKSCPKGDMVLVENQQTGLVYNAAFNQALMTYDDNYQNEQAISPLFKDHLETVSDIVVRCMGRDSLAEVGCGKGFFLEMLLEKGSDVIGFDPTYEGNNPRVLRHFFQPGVSVQAYGLILRHVLEHVQNPFNFLLQLKKANGGSGRIYIEVPCFDWICKYRAWFDIYYEHVNYFRLLDFQRMFGAIIESGRIFDDQYLYVVAELASLREPEINFDEKLIFPKDFEETITGTGYTVSKQSVIWGGASKGVIFALLKERAGQPVGAVIDINPAKQGKYLPATGLLVQSHTEVLETLPMGTDIYVMNSNYLEEIKKMSNNAFNYIEVDHD